jgi:hypothetical protein
MPFLGVWPVLQLKAYPLGPTHVFSVTSCFLVSFVSPLSLSLSPDPLHLKPGLRENWAAFWEPESTAPETSLREFNDCIALTGDDIGASLHHQTGFIEMIHINWEGPI